MNIKQHNLDQLQKLAVAMQEARLHGLPESGLLEDYHRNVIRPGRRSPWVLVAFFAVAVLCVVGPLDYADALEREAEEKVLRVHRVLLETSTEPATLDECARAHPLSPRADEVVSFQNGTLTPWHHRTCSYYTRRQK